jgi:hypothetical protein
MKIKYLSKEEREYFNRIYARWQYGGNFTIYDINIIEQLLSELSEARYKLTNQKEKRIYPHRNNLPASYCHLKPL